MSGIAAIVNVDGSAVSQFEVERVANVLNLYGPYRQKILVLGSAAFVFCHDELLPEDVYESQPLQLANRFVLLFDGRIDNRSELGDILGISTSDLSLTADSMMALRLFERRGERAFEKITGAFAIIIMDLQDGRMLCARDHMGLRVLHYHRSAARFAVATAPEALFALSWVPRILNKEKVADNLVRQGGNHEITYYRDIYRVPPGTIVHQRGANISKQQFWSPKNIADIRYKDDNEYVEAFKERLDAAVRANLRSRRSACATITGGLDSSSIAVTAAGILARSGNSLDTFTAVPEAGFTREELPGRYFDEAPYVRQIAEFSRNIVPHFITQSRDPTPQNIAESIRVTGLPGATLNDLWGFDIFSAARSAGHNVMLTGEIGNITMSYDGRGLFTELLLSGHWLRLFSEIKSSGYRWRRYMRQHVIQPLIPAAVFRGYRQWRRGSNEPWYSYSFIRPEFAAQVGIFDRAVHGPNPFDAPHSRDSRRARINVIQGWCEAADLLAKLRVSFQLDIRAPAFDRRIVEFCLGIPENQYLRDGQNRWLIRRAMRGRLPDVVINQKKTGAQAADWYPRLTRVRHEIGEEVKRLAQNPEVSSILDLERLTAMLTNWPDHQPAEYTSAQSQLLAIPDALGTAYFIEMVTGASRHVAPAGVAAA